MVDGPLEATIEDPLLTPARVATIFGVTPYTVRTWLKDGTIQGIKLPSGHWRIAQSEVKRYANTKFGS